MFPYILIAARTHRSRALRNGFHFFYTTPVVALALLVIVLMGSVRVQAQGDSDIHMSALLGDVNAVQQHIAAGSNLDAIDAYGSSPLTIAATFGRTDVATALIAAGANLAITESHGSNPLHLAAYFGHADIATALIAKGADKFIRNMDGSTALDIAATPFADDKADYDKIAMALTPLGFVPDSAKVEAARPLIAAMLRVTPPDLADVAYDPVQGDDWATATPAEAGLDPMLVAEMYYDAAHLQNLYSLLVIKDGKLIAEDYFHAGSIDQLSTRHSITKSMMSALYGTARDRGCMPDLDAKMLSFFPELEDKIDDPRKLEITVRQMLQMRGGYPQEVSSVEHHDILYFTDNWNWVPHLADFPLFADPGTKFQYSNVTSQSLAVLLARSCETDLLPFSQEHLFGPIGVDLAKWSADSEGYRMGWGEIYMTARDMAKFGLLYLNDGAFGGTQVLPADWVDASQTSHSPDPWITPKVGRYLREIGYGYQWWSARAGEHDIDFAWGHGGQLIVLLDKLDMIIVTTADPQLDLDPVRDLGWERELAIINVVGKFVSALPEN